MIAITKELIDKLDLVSEYYIADVYNIKHTEVRKACYYQELVPYGQTEKGLYYFTKPEVNHYITTRKKLQAQIESNEEQKVNDLMTTQEVASLLGCSKFRVIALRQNNIIKKSWCVLDKDAKTYRFKRKQIEKNKDVLIEYINSHSGVVSQQTKKDKPTAQVLTEKDIQGCDNVKIRLLKVDGTLPVEVYQQLLNILND